MASSETADQRGGDPALDEPVPRAGLDDDTGLPPEPEVVPLGPFATIVRRALLVAVLPAFSLAYLWQAWEIEVPERALAVSPRSFPLIIGSLLAISSLVLALLEVRRMLRLRSATATGEEVPPEIDDDQERITSWRDAWVTLAALVVYVVVFATLGFFISTVAFLVGLASYFAPRKVLRNVLVSVAVSYAVYLLFVNVLNVQLPAGVLSGVM